MMVKVMLNQPSNYNTKTVSASHHSKQSSRAGVVRKHINYKTKKEKETALTSTYLLSSIFNIYLANCENCEKHFHRV